MLRRRLESRSDKEWILLKGEGARRSGKPVYLAHEQRRGWSEPLPLYLWWCEDCRAFVVSHPHGYGRIMCPANPAEHRARVFKWQRFRDKTLRPAGDIILALLVVIAAALLIVALFWKLWQSAHPQ